jgi:ArsR family transcriptional regulator, arsenate/arsenite/antimonite-responsive transcriptional repressor
MEISNAVGSLTSLAHETRLAVFRLLVQVGEDGMSAGRIAEALGVPPSSLSHHLKDLKFAGLVSCRREQRSLIYAANFDGMNGLLDFLLDDCCGGHPEICDPRTARNSCS